MKIANKKKPAELPVMAREPRALSADIIKNDKKENVTMFTY